MTVEALYIAEKHAVSLGRMLARARGERTGEAVAHAAGISRRTLIKIEQGDPTVAMGSYRAVAREVGCPWLVDVIGPPQAQEPRVPRHYLTGVSALCLPGPDAHPPALWYSSALGVPQHWHIAGAKITGAVELLGAIGLWDATEAIAQYGVRVEQLWAASHERAMFDLLYHYCELNGKPVPNVQATDIDDVVDLGQIFSWIQQLDSFLTTKGKERMHTWLSKAIVA